MAEDKKEREGEGAEEQTPKKRSRRQPPRDADGNRIQSYRRFKEGEDYQGITAERTKALCDLMRRSFLGVEDTEAGEIETRRKRTGRPRKYETVESFVDVASRYIDYIAARGEEGLKIIPDVEGFCSFAGIDRDTLREWEKTRDPAYSATIKAFKNSIAAYKKQLALNGEIPPIVFATDFNNNHGYTQTQKVEVEATRKLDDLPSRDDIVKRLPPASAGGIDADPDIDL